MFRESSREKDGLTVWTDVINDFHHLRLETHVEHPVGLVQYEICGPLEVRDATRICCEQVNHATWSADNNFSSLLHLSDLIFDGGSSVRADSLEEEMSACQVNLIEDVLEDLGLSRRVCTLCESERPTRG